jgi:hypothetical protein
MFSAAAGKWAGTAQQRAMVVSCRGSFGGVGMALLYNVGSSWLTANDMEAAQCEPLPETKSATVEGGAML